ncbi:MAG: heavy-metal-associated domain-containing protein [Pseudomonadota bacterium]
MTKITTVLTAMALTFAAPIAVAQTETAETAMREATMLTVNVKGMVCDFCARAVTKVFGKEDAVDGVHVDLDKGEIHVGLKPGMNLSDEDVEQLVKKSGYAMVSVEREVL